MQKPSRRRPRGAYPLPDGGWVVNNKHGLPIDTKTGKVRIYVDERPHPNVVKLARAFLMLAEQQVAARPQEIKRRSSHRSK